MSHGTSILDGFIGPCVHGRDPYDRCDGCGQLTPAQAEAVARAETFPPLTRERAREWLVSEMDRIESAEMDRAVLYDLVIEYDNGEQLLGALADLLVDAANGRIK